MTGSNVTVEAASVIVTGGRVTSSVASQAVIVIAQSLADDVAVGVGIEKSDVGSNGEVEVSAGVLYAVDV